jgi:hypothetical protein
MGERGAGVVVGAGAWCGGRTDGRDERVRRTLSAFALRVGGVGCFMNSLPMGSASTGEVELRVG